MISLECLKKNIKICNELERKADVLYEAFKVFADDSYVCVNGESVEAIIELLSVSLENSQTEKAVDETLSYWYYDLNCGKNWKVGSMQLSDGMDIKLETIEDVYNYYKNTYYEN